MAVALLRRSGTALNRDTLRPPFYSQCYVTGPLALGHGVAGQLALVAAPNAVAAGLVVFALTMIWYVVVETRWFRADLKISTAKAAMIVVVTTCAALVIMVAIVAFVAVAAG